MRIERWYWLGVFCLVSFLIHAGIAWKSPGLGQPAPAPKQAEIEVALLAPPEEAKPVPKPPPPTPKPKPAAKHSPEPPTRHKPDSRPPTEVVKRSVKPAPVKIVRRMEPIDEDRPAAPDATPGGFDK